MSLFKRQIIIELAVILSAFIILGGGVWFLSSRIERTATQLSAFRESSALGAEEFETFLTLKKESAQAFAVLPNLKSKLPSRYDLLSFPKMTEKLAKSRGIGFSLFFLNENPATDKLPASIGFSASASGTLAAIVNLVSDLENGPNLLKISDMDLNSNSTRINGSLFFK